MNRFTPSKSNKAFVRIQGIFDRTFNPTSSQQEIRYIVLDGSNDDAAANGNSLQGSTTQAQGTSVSPGASHGIDQMVTNSLSATYTDTGDNMNADGISSNEIGNDTSSCLIRLII
ncbi:unnamed protein product [Adineta ricciae]|uniref:Uncharacterized protein n=1 Tax=Adineta ricciae TaxID=249248 RepID=A0A815ACM1_ADIRI|nr:unnamed protein product [Adineta ricciae]